MAGCKQHNIRTSYDEPNCPQFTSKITEPPKNYTQYYDCGMVKNLGHGVVVPQPGGGTCYFPNKPIIPVMRVTYTIPIKTSVQPEDVAVELQKVMAIREAYREAHPLPPEPVVSSDGLGGYFVPPDILAKLIERIRALANI